MDFGSDYAVCHHYDGKKSEIDLLIYYRYTLQMIIKCYNQGINFLKEEKAMNTFRNLYLYSEYSLLSLYSDEGIFVMQ